MDYGTLDRILAMRTVAEKPTDLRTAISAAYLDDETTTVEALLARVALAAVQSKRIENIAQRLAAQVRERPGSRSGAQHFLQEFGLSTREGVLLMCMAEALLRVPDTETADQLIADKLTQGQWERYAGHSDSLLVNASTWALLLTGRLLAPEDTPSEDAFSALRRLIARGGESLVRLAITQAMRILARQFVMGRDIEQALTRSREAPNTHYRYSFDMLGEAALTRREAQIHYDAYAQAIAYLEANPTPSADIFSAPSISVKLSALHPRFEHTQGARVMSELTPRVTALVALAKAAGLGFTVDAEESDRLELTLDVFAAVFADRSLHGYDGLGLAVQAYQKRALPVIDWLAQLARERRKRIPVRLVKGAYWDSEIKRAQAAGLSEYPVFTRKAATDVSYLACARLLLEQRDAFYPQFATHNAHTAAAILDFAQGRKDFELQRLHGMGEALYEVLSTDATFGMPACRVYAPVGSHEDLLPYLVRRLLENGANTSFVHDLADPRVPIERLAADPVKKLGAYARKSNPRIALPRDLYTPQRRNSKGISFSDPLALTTLRQKIRAALDRQHAAGALIGTESAQGAKREIRSPADHREAVGVAYEADIAALERALAIAAPAAASWERVPAQERASVLEAAADHIESETALLMALLVREGGKTLPDAIAEVREAADYCRYYAQIGREAFAEPRTLDAITGERNQLRLRGRGVFAAISPWNFPLAIFVGQITAALAAGNAVIAKPARQTPLVGCAAVRLLHAAGIPRDVLHFVPGPGSTLGARLASDPRIAGIVFTGSTETAQSINRTLAARSGAIVPLIAETGGQNAMIVDSTALPEQTVADALRSAFNSAGQRCSALRVLFVQEDIAVRVIELLRDALQELVVGDPALLTTDVGPVIDASAKTELERHILAMQTAGKLLGRASLPAQAEYGHFVAPCVFEIPHLRLLTHEVFGPVLHVVRYQASHLDAVIDAINATGFGLTLGIQSRIDATVEHICARARVGNIYVNRDIIGAVVGAQPFGGEGLSGTGPKAGGPHYLLRFATERVTSINTAAAGGNAALLNDAAD
jgi:RHH-type proline utilization regulon transcriptional repressor/proline dehydrogenase/delta 1-pyrroline-5-carboxylate dehydrogenase